MSASSLFSKLLALLATLLLLISTTLAFLLRRRSLELRALVNQATLDRAGDRLASADRDQLLADEHAARYAAHMASLRQVAVALSAAHESHQLLDTIVDAARVALGVTHASIGQIDAARGQLTIIAVSAASHDEGIIGLELPLSGEPGGHPWQLDAPLEIADPRNDQRLAMLHDLLERSDAGTLLIVPLRAGGQLLGLLNLADTTARHFDDVDLDLAQALAGYAATMLDNQRLRETALQAERA
jgi:GAF domain-containing protein